jgi:hypothetical protein
MTLETSRVMALVPDGSFQDIAIKTGDWSNPATWKGGVVPKDMDNVLISPNVDVTISGDVSKDASGNRVAIHALRVDGTLAFDTSDLFQNAHALRRLLVDTIVVTPASASDPMGGTFQMGTMSSPIPAGVKADVIFADNGPVNAPSNTDSALSTLWPDGDPYQFSRGLIVMGSASIDGTEVTSEEPVQPGPTGETSLVPGSATLTLAPGNVPTNWNVGDQLVITGDQTIYTGKDQDEQATLQAISTDPATGVTEITISTPLQYLHYAPAGASIYVADVTRNVVFESKNTAQVADRGHVMFMHTENIQVDAAGFYGLGRTDKNILINDPNPIIDPANPGTPGHPNYIENGTGLNPRGRYAVHFHHDDMMDPKMPDTINDSAVVGSPGWGIVNHSSNVDVTNNVAYNVFGASFVTEAGDEIGTFDHNIAIHSTGSQHDSFGDYARDNVQDFGFDGEGFWFQGGNISVTNNIAADTVDAYFLLPIGLVQKLPVGVDSSGKYVFRQVSTMIPASALGWLSAKPVDSAGMVNDLYVPLKQFSNNVAFAASFGGFEAWESKPLPGAYSVIDDLHVYMSHGVDINTSYSNNFVFNNVIEIGDVNNALSYGAGYAANGSTYNITFNNPDIEGFYRGIQVTEEGPTSIVGGKFRDVQDIYVMPADVGHEPVNGFNINLNQVVNITGDTFIPLSPAAAGYRTQYDVYYPSNFNLAHPDISKLFDVNVGSFSTVMVDGKQVYYDEQASDYVPFPSGTASPYVPAALLDLTNAKIFSKYGLAIGGAVAPADAAVNPPGIYGVLGSPFAYQTVLNLVSARYTTFHPTSPSYLLAYSYLDPATGQLVTVRESTPTQLVAGWNLLTRSITIDGKTSTRTFLVYATTL